MKHRLRVRRAGGRPLLVGLALSRAGRPLFYFLYSRGLCPRSPGMSRREVCLRLAGLLVLGVVPGLLYALWLMARRVPRDSAANTLAPAAGALGLGGLALWLWRPGPAALVAAWIGVAASLLLLAARLGAPWLGDAARSSGPGMALLLAGSVWLSTGGGLPAVLLASAGGAWLLASGLVLGPVWDSRLRRVGEARGILRRGECWGCNPPVAGGGGGGWPSRLLQVYARTGLLLAGEWERRAILEGHMPPEPGLEDHALAAGAALALAIALGAPPGLMAPLALAALLLGLASGPRGLAVVGALSLGAAPASALL